MRLSPQLRNRLRRAIGAAFSSYDELRIVIGEGDWPNLFNVQLEKIAKPDPQDIVIYNLVTWAEKTGRVRNLVEICLAANPSNPQLQTVAEEVRNLPEEPIDGSGDPNEVAIDPTVYRPPPRPLTRHEKRLRKINASLLAALAIEVLAWSAIFIGQTRVVVIGTLIPGIASVVWAMFSDRPLMLRAFNIASSILTHRSVLPTLTMAIVVFTAISLAVSQVKYNAPPDAPAVQVADTDLSPGDIKWVGALPWGRSVTVDKVGAGYRSGAYPVYPWHRTLLPLEMVPYVVIEPRASVLKKISVDDDDPTRAWTLTVQLNGTEVVRLASYKGGPVKLGEDKSYWPDPPNFKAIRPDKTVRKVVKIEPGDSFHVSLTRGTTQYTTDFKVANPKNLETAAQLVHIPE